MIPARPTLTLQRCCCSVAMTVASRRGVLISTMHKQITIIIITPRPRPPTTTLELRCETHWIRRTVAGWQRTPGRTRGAQHLAWGMCRGESEDSDWSVDQLQIRSCWFYAQIRTRENYILIFYSNDGALPNDIISVVCSIVAPNAAGLNIYYKCGLWLFL